MSQRFPLGLSDSEGSSDDGSLMSMAYSFEPSVTDSESSSETSSNESEDRLSNTSWYDAANCRMCTRELTSSLYRCECGHCTIMATNTECVCCRESAPILSKINSLEDSTIHCITEHPGFSPVCLNTWVLQTAYYYEYRQHHGVSSSPSTLHE